mmetsp:Transcript_105151/g.172849  ORF Transcript_105151/g.172849 Transcript_105151/m.172849 type:complete len:168 (-) Transcript_105151:44-547(-)
MEPPLQLQPCKVLLLREIMEQTMVGASLRVTGVIERLEGHPSEAGPQHVLLGDRGSRLWVDISQLGHRTDVRRFSHGGLLQVLGEVEAAGEDLWQSLCRPGVPRLLLRARLARQMAGLDLNLYEQCLRVRREFEAQFCPPAGLSQELPSENLASCTLPGAATALARG